MNEPMDHDIPVLTDILTDGDARPATSAMPATSDETESARTALPLHQIQQTLTDRLVAELSLQVPVLIESALREYLPQAMGARLQAEILTALTNALPAAAQSAAAELSGRVAYEVGGLLEQRLQEEVRRAVADEIERLTGQSS